MLGNQMRGRAIRIDKKVPDKVSNIWHLTTMLPEHLNPSLCKQSPPSADYQVLERRFRGFLGLHYSECSIESGLQRAITLKPPFNRQNVNLANEKSFEMAQNRESSASRWMSALEKSSNEVLIQNEIPRKKGFFPDLFIPINRFGVIKKITYAVMRAFKDLGQLPKKTKAKVEKDYNTKTVNASIFRCSKYEKNIFHQAMSEVFGPIDNPKYVLVKTKGDRKIFRMSFAVPEAFAKNKETAEVFKERMGKRVANFDLHFTRSAEGKQIMQSVKKKAHVNRHFEELAAKMKLRAK
jgi:hypothetical protein